MKYYCFKCQEETKIPVTLQPYRNNSLEIFFCINCYEELILQNQSRELI